MAGKWSSILLYEQGRKVQTKFWRSLALTQIRKENLKLHKSRDLLIEGSAGWDESVIISKAFQGSLEVEA